MNSQIPSSKSQTPTGLLASVLVVALGLWVVGLNAQQQIRTAKQMPFPKNPDWAKLEVETLPVQGKVHLIAGAGGNIAAQVGDDGILLVDTGYEQMAGKVVAAIRSLAPGRTLRTIINTTLADAHTGANGLLIKEGRLNQAGPGLGQRPNEADLSGIL